MPDIIDRYGNILLRGLAVEFAPQIASGVLVELLTKGKVDVDTVVEWVQKDRSLWDELGIENQTKLKKALSRVGKLNWMTADWAVNAVRSDFPAICSLFLGWKKGENWLNRQIEIIKEEVKS